MRSCRRIADARANAHACDQPYYAPPLPRRQVLGKRAHLATRASAPQAAASLKASPAEELAAITNEARERLALKVQLLERELPIDGLKPTLVQEEQYYNLDFMPQLNFKIQHTNPNHLKTD